MINIEYLLDLGFNADEVEKLKNSLNPNIIYMLTLFSKIVAVNYQVLNNLGIKNLKEVFSGHSKIFLTNPDRFKAIFAKYDQEDLIRCLEKKPAIIEKL